MTPPSYPPAARLDLVEDVSGVPVADPYRWLEDATAPETEAWSAAQDALFDAERAHWPGRDRLRVRLTELLAAGWVSPPSWRGSRQFFMRRTAEQEHGILLTVDPDGTERILIDPMAIDPSGITTLDSWQPSKEGSLLAYQLSEGGTEESRLRVMDVATGEIVDGPVDRARYSPVAWLPGGKAFYYVRRLPADEVPADEEQYHRRVWLHRLGTDAAQDTLIFGDGLAMTNYYGVSVSLDGRWLVVSASAGTAPRNDLWIADLTAGTHEAPAFRVVQENVDASTSIHVGRDGRAYIFTDRDAPRGRVCVTTPEEPGHEGWTDLVPEDPEAVLEDYAVLDGDDLAEPVLLVGWTRHAVSEVSVHRLDDGRRTGAIALPGLGSVGRIVERPEGGHEAWFGYTDHTTPPQVYHYDARSGGLALWSSAPGSARDVPAVRADQLVYTSADGTPVRMFVIAPGDRDADGASAARPTVLYGYGGFGVPLTPGYSAAILAWVEAGGVYAIANLRGGSEEGEQWHRAGMRENKQRVFEDFHAAAEHLVAEGWTTPDRLAVSGGSNGGLLVGAAVTQRPELYTAAVCSAPLLDMVRYERFGLGATWNDEYGTASDPVELGWLLGYSPYHHVRPGTDYPAVLFTIFDSDTRVDPLHARKMAAALQHATTGERPILLRREKNVGHSSRAVSRAVELSVDTTAFLAQATGLPIGPLP